MHQCVGDARALCVTCLAPPGDQTCPFTVSLKALSHLLPRNVACVGGGGTVYR
jgi:hypothetical protein